MANSVITALKNSRPLSVWEVMIPVLLIFNFAKSKNDKELFIQNFLFTKELALKAALDMTKNNRSKAEVVSPILEKTKNLLETVSSEIYSEGIRQKQLEEIDVLIDHYCKLLDADGSDYDSLLMNAYPNREDYVSFLDQRKAAEKEVTTASNATLGEKANIEFAAKMEAAVDRIRAAEVERIFEALARRQDAK